MYEKIKNLPIAPFLEDICGALKNSPSRFLILTAETAAGKSTAVPLALIKNFCFNEKHKKIVMLEPRRLAVINIASRVAELLDENLGETCGYSIHLESKISKQTKFIVYTEAILTRKIQMDPSLEDVSVVVIDEFHERSIHSDLALAFLKEAMLLRDDLYVIVMSATMNTVKLSEYLNAPVFHVPGRQFPVVISYQPQMTVTESIIEESKKLKGSILVFLPGLFEIKKIKKELETFGVKQEICILHSSVSISEQKKVLFKEAENSFGRIILSSAIAETSLTVPDVTVVIDSGFSRVNFFNKTVGIETLVTVKESEFSAQQRSGRAGRIAPGKCIRLWDEHDLCQKESIPEILRTDLLSLVLECNEWGVKNREQLSWLDSPPENSWEQAETLLEQIGCITKEKDVTTKGKIVLLMGINPRIACVALKAVEIAEILNLSISEKEEIIHYVIDEILCMSVNKNLLPYVQKKFTEDLTKKLISAKLTISDKDKEIFKNDFSEEIINKKIEAYIFFIAGYPDRIAKKVENSSKDNFWDYQLPSGRILSLYSDKHEFPEYLIILEADAGERSGKIFDFKEINSQKAEHWLFNHSECSSEINFSDENAKLNSEYIGIEKYNIIRYGAIVLKRTKINPEKNDFIGALHNCIKLKGIEYLPLNDCSKNLLLRVQFYIQNIVNIEKEQVFEKKLKDLNYNSNEWLEPFIIDKNNKYMVTDKIVYEALYWYLNGNVIDKEVPLELILPNGKKKKVVYIVQENEIIPVIEVIIQQVFGLLKTPVIMGKPVLFKLLSPASRPLQVTNDLEKFWVNTWPEICKEMKGRYPKHNWDYRIVVEK